MKSAATQPAAHSANATPNSSGEPATRATRAHVPDTTAIVNALACRAVTRASLACRAIPGSTIAPYLSFSIAQLENQIVTSMFRYRDNANDGQTARLLDGVGPRTGGRKSQKGNQMCCCLAVQGSCSRHPSAWSVSQPQQKFGCRHQPTASAIGLIGAGVLPIGTSEPSIASPDGHISRAAVLGEDSYGSSAYSFHRQAADERSASYEMQPGHVIPGGTVSNLQSVSKIRQSACGRQSLTAFVRQAIGRVPKRNSAPSQGLSGPAQFDLGVCPSTRFLDRDTHR